MNRYIEVLKSLFSNFFNKKDIYYVVENVDWSIKHDGIMITSNLPRLKTSITTVPWGIKDSIVHYGAIGTFLTSTKLKLPHPSNKIVVTWFHIAPNDKKIDMVSEALKYVDIWHTSCYSTKEKMIKMGIPKDKIMVVPLGIDLSYFKIIENDEKRKIKEELGIPKDKIIVGSFQKDGNGWGEGLEPKLIKGPDIFCDVVEKVSKKYDIFVLLTGPSRGYVKKRLEKANIPYLHHFLKTPNEVNRYFQITDLYLVTSREEGGPKSILESMACGVPLVTTKVGMAPDIIKDGHNGFLSEIEDSDTIYERSCEVLDNASLKEELIKNGYDTVLDFDWKDIADKYFEKIYKGFL